MALWIEFYKSHNGQIMEALGSDGFQRVDGRFSITRAINEGHKRAYNLRNVQRSYIGFKICRGDMPSRCQPVTGLIPLREHG